MRLIARWARKTYHDLSLCVRIPHADDARVSADHEDAPVLLPVGDNTGTALHLQHLVQSTECADHLHGAAA